MQKLSVLTVRSFILLVIVIWAATVSAQAAFDKQHSILTGELKKYVDSSGVHYAKWKQHPQELDRYLAQLAAISADQYNRFNDNEKKALWVNAYNALIIRIVLDHYPIHGSKTYYPPDSARQIPNLWEAYRFKVAGRDVNLYDIEHKIIRKDFKDPRMHFVVVCASRGCPSLKSSAYTAATMERDLDAAARKFMTDTKHVEFDSEHKLLKVSKLFEWFPLDFAPPAGSKLPATPLSDDEIVLSYALSFAPQEIQKDFADPKQIHVMYMEYDWSLNDADRS